MRLLTWNVCRGPFAAKWAYVEPLAPDVAVLQECARPTEFDPRRCVWVGDNPNQGVAVLVGPKFTLEAVPRLSDLPRWVVPVRVHGRRSFLLFAVWTQPEPRYVDPVFRALDAYEGMIRSEPTVFMGDFNSNAIWDRMRKPARDHSALVARFAHLGMISSYHVFFKEEQGSEARPTHYHRWRESTPFHIDYCFVPDAWVATITSVEVGGYAEWAKVSDHRPLLVDVTSPASSAAEQGVAGDVRPGIVPE